MFNASWFHLLCDFKSTYTMPNLTVFREKHLLRKPDSSVRLFWIYTKMSSITGLLFPSHSPNKMLLYYRCQDMTAVWLNRHKQTWRCKNWIYLMLFSFVVHRSSDPLILFYKWSVLIITGLFKYICKTYTTHTASSRCRPYLCCPWWKGPYAAEIKRRLNLTATAVVMKGRPKLIFLNRKSDS